MNEPTHLQKVFQGILSTQSFELLDTFLPEESWGELQSHEKETLAQLFLLRADSFARGEHDHEAKEMYQAACRLLPGSAKCWYRFGLYQSTLEHDEDLIEAYEFLKKAVAFDDGFFDAHFTLASTALKLAVMRRDSEFLIHADASFSKAVSLSSEEALPGVLFWQWGIVWFSQGRDSGEPTELKKACELFKKAKSRGISHPEFFTDYGDALFEFVQLTSSDTFLIDAIGLYQEAIDLTHDLPSEKRNKSMRYYKLGACYCYLFELFRDERHFDDAQKAFTRAFAYYQDNSLIFPKWGALLLRGAKIWDETDLYDAACVKFRLAEEKGEQSSILFAHHAEALLSIGGSLEERDLIARAEDYARRAKELDVEDICPEASAMVAMCKLEYGRYFQEEKYFEEAKALLQKALVVHPKSAMLWYVFGLTKVAGESVSEPSIKEALLCFHLASRSQYAEFPHFWNEWGMALMMLGEVAEEASYVEDAIQKIEKACELADRDCLEWKFNLAYCYELLGELNDNEECYEKAIGLFSQVVQDDAACTDGLFHLARSYMHMGEITDESEPFSLACDLFQKYLALEPEDGEAWTDYALSSIHKGVIEREGESLPAQWFSAEDSLLKAISLGEDSSLYSLACLYSLMGNLSEAMAALEQAYTRKSLPSFQSIKEDVWLQPLSSAPQFQRFCDRLEHEEKT